MSFGGFGTCSNVFGPSIYAINNSEKHKREIDFVIDCDIEKTSEFIDEIFDIWEDTKTPETIKTIKEKALKCKTGELELGDPFIEVALYHALTIYTSSTDLSNDELATKVLETIHKVLCVAGEHINDLDLDFGNRTGYFNSVLMYIVARYKEECRKCEVASNDYDKLYNIVYRDLRSVERYKHDINHQLEDLKSAVNKDRQASIEISTKAMKLCELSIKRFELQKKETEKLKARIAILEDQTSFYQEIEQLREDLKDKTHQNGQLRSNIALLETTHTHTISKLRKENTSLKNSFDRSIKDMRKEVDELKKSATKKGNAPHHLDRLRSEITELRKEISDLKAKKPDGSRPIDQLRDETNELKTRVSNLETELKEQQDINVGLVAAIDKLKLQVIDEPSPIYIYDYEEMKQTRAALHAELRLYYKPFAKLIAIAYNTPVATIAKRVIL